VGSETVNPVIRLPEKNMAKYCFIKKLQVPRISVLLIILLSAFFHRAAIFKIQPNQHMSRKEN
jgi:hypothetical protein